MNALLVLLSPPGRGLSPKRASGFTATPGAVPPRVFAKTREQVPPLLGGEGRGEDGRSPNVSHFRRSGEVAGGGRDFSAMPGCELTLTGN